MEKSEYIPKSRYDKILNALFIILVALTFFNLYKVIIWLSVILAALFLLVLVLHIRDYLREKPEKRKAFILSVLVLANFFLANAVIVISNYVYPY